METESESDTGAAAARCGGQESDTTMPDDACTGSGCEACSVGPAPDGLLLGLALLVGLWLRRRR